MAVGMVQPEYPAVARLVRQRTICCLSRCHWDVASNCCTTSDSHQSLYCQRRMPACPDYMTGDNQDPHGPCRDRTSSAYATGGSSTKAIFRPRSDGGGDKAAWRTLSKYLHFSNYLSPTRKPPVPCWKVCLPVQALKHTGRQRLPGTRWIILDKKLNELGRMTLEESSPAPHSNERSGCTAGTCGYGSTPPRYPSRSGPSIRREMSCSMHGHAQAQMDMGNLASKIRLGITDVAWSS